MTVQPTFPKRTSPVSMWRVFLFKGAHGFEGTEAYYGPFELIHANNLANTTDQTGAFDIDLEQVLTWDPEIIFLISME